MRRAVMGVILAAALSGGAAAPAAGEPAYFGHWTLNVKKSDLGRAQNFTIAAAADGEYLFTDAFGKSYRFRVDGTPYRDDYGGLNAWTQLDGSTWEATTTIDGRLAGIDRLRLQSDGRTMVDESEAVQTSGGRLHQTMHYARTGTGRGLVGAWKGGRVESDSFDLEIRAEPDGMISFQLGDVYQARLRFDGQPYPISGTIVLPSTTARMRPAGARAFTWTMKAPNGPGFSARFEVTPDGNTMTERGGAVGQSVNTWIWERR